MVAPRARPPLAKQHPCLSWNVDGHGFLHITIHLKRGQFGASEEKVDRVFLSPDDTERLIGFLEQTRPIRENAWRTKL